MCYNWGQLLRERELQSLREIVPGRPVPPACSEELKTTNGSMGDTDMEVPIFIRLRTGSIHSHDPAHSPKQSPLFLFFLSQGESGWPIGRPLQRFPGRSPPDRQQSLAKGLGWALAPGWQARRQLAGNCWQLVCGGRVAQWSLTGLWWAAGWSSLQSGPSAEHRGAQAQAGSRSARAVLSQLVSLRSGQRQAPMCEANGPLFM